MKHGIPIVRALHSMPPELFMHRRSPVCRAIRNYRATEN